MLRSMLSSVLADPKKRERVRKMLNNVGYDTTDWLRVEMYRSCFERVRQLCPENLDVLEISGGSQWKREFSFKSYTATQFPDFDLCAQRLPQTFDLIIADQVFEHLPWPYRAGKNVHAMLKPGGTFIITVPFLVRIHASPSDYSRWTPEGLRHFLQECGFANDAIETKSWGNRACVKANFNAWRSMGWYKSLKNEEDFPVVVWAFARG